MLEFVVGGIIGFLSGFAIRVLYDEVKEPKLFIDDDEKHLECVWVYPEGKPPMYICRIFVYNKKKRILNYVAKNCIAWVKSTKKETKEQISWVGGSSLDINVDDYQKVNLFAIVKGTNNFAFGTEKDETNLRPPYFEPNKESVEFILKITCSNGKGDSVKIKVEEISYDGECYNVDCSITHSAFLHPLYKFLKRE